jgi:hypothetical protein
MGRGDGPRTRIGCFAWVRGPSGVAKQAPASLERCVRRRRASVRILLQAAECFGGWLPPRSSAGCECDHTDDGDGRRGHERSRRRRRRLRSGDAIPSAWIAHSRRPRAGPRGTPRAMQARRSATPWVVAAATICRPVKPRARSSRTSRRRSRSEVMSQCFTGDVRCGRCARRRRRPDRSRQAPWLIPRHVGRCIGSRLARSWRPSVTRGRARPRRRARLGARSVRARVVACSTSKRTAHARRRRWVGRGSMSVCAAIGASCGGCEVVEVAPTMLRSVADGRRRR